MALLAILYLFFGTAFADDLCSTYEEFCPGYMRSAGSAAPSLLSGSGTNPSSLPTEPSPFGLELAYNTAGDLTSSGSSLGAVKGLSGHGFGFSSTKNNTFYDYSLKQALQGAGLTDITNTTNPNTGRNYTASAQNMERTLTAFSYATSLFPKSEIFTPALGASAVIDQLSSTLNFAFGASLKTRIFSLGWSHLPLGANTTKNVPQTSSTYLNAGLSLGSISAEYCNLNHRTKDSSLKSLSLFTRPVNIFTLTYESKKLHLTVARRESTNVTNQRVHLHLASIVWRASKYMSLSLMKNYIPSTHSFGLQFFF